MLKATVVEEAGENAQPICTQWPLPGRHTDFSRRQSLMAAFSLSSSSRLLSRSSAFSTWHWKGVWVLVREMVGQPPFRATSQPRGKVAHKSGGKVFMLVTPPYETTDHAEMATRTPCDTSTPSPAQSSNSPHLCRRVYTPH